MNICGLDMTEIYFDTEELAIQKYSSFQKEKDTQTYKYNGHRYRLIGFQTERLGVMGRLLELIKAATKGVLSLIGKSSKKDAWDHWDHAKTGNHQIKIHVKCSLNVTLDAPQEMIGKKFGTEGKPLIKINYKYFWSNFNVEEFLESWGITKDYQFMISDKPDFVFFSVYEPGRTPYHVPHVEGDFTRIFYSGENVRPDMTRCEWAFTFEYDEELQHPHHLRFPNYMRRPIKEHICPTDRTALEKIKAQKTKFCNFVYSNPVPFRNRFFEELSKYKHVDSPGHCCNNMSPIKANDPFASRRKSDWIKDKYEFLEPYKFTIAIENELHPGYTTEKLADPLIKDSVPIYWGNPLVERDFNPKKFIHLRPEEYSGDEETMIQKLVQKVIQVDQDDELYESYLREPIFADNKHSDGSMLLGRMHEIFKND